MGAMSIRRGFSGKNLNYNDKGELVLVSFGVDATSEHEWGIQLIRDGFGITGRTKKDIGLASRTMTKIPADLVCETLPDESMVLHFDCKYLKNYLDTELRMGLSEGWSGAWSDGRFALRARGEMTLMVTELWSHFQKKNIAIWTGKIGTLVGSGLVVAVASRIPAADALVMKKMDEDKNALEKEVNRIGIIERLQAAGKTWFALSPEWRESLRGKSTTKYKVVFWLNPKEQDLHHSCWCTVEDLELWAKNKGPIMKTERR